MHRCRSQLIGQGTDEGRSTGEVIGLSTASVRTEHLSKQSQELLTDQAPIAQFSGYPAQLKEATRGFAEIPKTQIALNCGIEVGWENLTKLLRAYHSSGDTGIPLGASQGSIVEWGSRLETEQRQERG